MSAVEEYRPKCALKGCYAPVRDSRAGGWTKYCSEEHAIKAHRSNRPRPEYRSAAAWRHRAVGADDLGTSRQQPQPQTHRLTFNPRVVFRPQADALPPRRDEHGFIAAFQDDIWATIDHGSPGMARSDIGWASVSVLGSIAGEGV